MWEGLLGSEKVCVKLLRIQNVERDNQKGPLAVCGIHELLVRSAITDIMQDFLQGSSCLEENEAPKRCTLLGRYDDTVTACVRVDAEWYLGGVRECQSPHGSNKSRAFATTLHVSKETETI